MKKKVLLTGISGWIAQYCAAELLRAGYLVVGTLRDMQRKFEVDQALSSFCVKDDQLTYYQCDLLEDEGWEDAIVGCDYVLHIASPFVMREPKDPEELITPAKEGTLRVLKAAIKNKVKRVVVTSSVVSMFSHLKTGVFNHESWTDLKSKRPNSYQRSKTIAEKAAWDFYHKQDGSHHMELVTINPGAVFGPTLSSDIEGASLGMCQKMIQGEMPGVPNMHIVTVDVRDVAKHHLQAMVHPDADGKRFISASQDTVSMRKMAELLHRQGFTKVPLTTVPSFLFKFLALFDSEAKAMRSFLNVNVSCDNSQTRKFFNWQPIPFEKTLLDMAQSVQDVIRRR